MNRNKAIEIVRMCCPKIANSECAFETAMRVLVPELKENESEDERIRNEIIRHLISFNNGYYERPSEKIIDSWISWLEKQGNPKMSAEAIREGIAHYGITQYQIDNWLKKYVEVETSVLPKYGIGDVIRLKNSDHEFIISHITGGYYHSKGAFIEIRIADDVNGDWEYVRHIQSEPKFNVGDTIIAKPENCMEHVPFHITSIENGFYWDGDDSILIDNQDEFVLVGKTVKEPAHKFSVGDFIADYYCRGRVVKLTDDSYLLDTGQGIPFSCEDNAHLWTIEDAKDGDVLAGYETIVLFKEIEDLYIKCYCTCYLGHKHTVWVDTHQDKSAYHPATKEQRKLLFREMKIAGYEWNAEKKELRKIEQNPADKAEPKFKIGDLITNGILVGKIDEIHGLGYHANFGNHYADVPDIENWHKWTIQDAKDGDVIVNGSNVFIFSHRSSTRAMGYCHINLDDRRFYDDKGKNECFGIIDTVFTPATKEQCDLLFQKMKEAGYEWDTEKKELRKINQSPAWSEEDEDIRLRLIDFLYGKSRLAKDREDGISWLKAFKERYTWKPSDEQMEYLAKAITTLGNEGDNKTSAILCELRADLKKLK